MSALGLSPRTYRLSYILVCALAVAFWGNISAHAEDVPTLLKEAYEKTKTARTLDQLDEVIQISQTALGQELPKEMANYARRLMSWAHNRRGETLSDEGNETAALAEFKKAVELEPGRWKAVHNLAVSLALQGEVEEALKRFDDVLEIKKNYPNAWFNRGELHYGRQEYARALRDYDEAILLDSEVADFHASRGHTLFLMGNFNDAMTAFDRALRLDSDHVAALVNRGEARNYLGQYQAALADFRRAIELDPNSSRAHRGLAWLLATCPDQNTRDSEAALTSAKKAVELIDGDDYHYLDTLAAALANAGQYAEAIEIQSTVLRLAPESEIEFYQRRMTTYEEGRPYLDSRRVSRGEPQGRQQRGNQVNRTGRRR